MSGAAFRALTIPAPSCTATRCDPPIRRCAGRSGDGATPPSPPTSTTAPAPDREPSPGRRGWVHLAFFGRPGFEDTWGWRFLGHHLSLSYTIIEQRKDEDLHAVSIPSASLLHIRELRWVTRGQGAQGGSAAWRCVPSEGTFARTLPVSSSIVRGVDPAG